MSNETSAAAERMREVRKPREAEPNVYTPRVDIAETEAAFVLVADVPGVDENDVDVTLEKNVLRLRGTVRPAELKGYGLAYAEYDTGAFEFDRSFTVSDLIEREAIEANVKDGVLRVTLPKAQQAASKKVQVTAG